MVMSPALGTLQMNASGHASHMPRNLQSARLIQLQLALAKAMPIFADGQEKLAIRPRIETFMGLTDLLVSSRSRGQNP